MRESLPIYSISAGSSLPGRIAAGFFAADKCVWFKQPDALIRLSTYGHAAPKAGETDKRRAEKNLDFCHLPGHKKWTKAHRRNWFRHYTCDVAKNHLMRWRRMASNNLVLNAHITKERFKLWCSRSNWNVQGTMREPIKIQQTRARTKGLNRWLILSVHSGWKNGWNGWQTHMPAIFTLARKKSHVTTRFAAAKSSQSVLWKWVRAERQNAGEWRDYIWREPNAKRITCWTKADTHSCTGSTMSLCFIARKLMNGCAHLECMCV